MNRSRSHSVSAVALIVGRILNGLMSLGAVMILSRLLTQELYGTYQQVWLVYNTALPFLMFGLPASITYFIPQMDARGQKMVVVQTAILLAFAGLLISIFTYASAGPLAAQFGGPKLRDLLRLFFLFPIFSLPLVFVDSLLAAIGKAQAAAWFNIFSAAVQFVAVVTPIALGYDLHAVMIMLNLSAIARFAAMAAYFLRVYRGVRLTWDVPFIARQMRYSIPLGLSSIVGTLTLQMNRLVVSSAFGAKSYAVYVNGATELPFVGIIASSVMTVVTPVFVQLYKDGHAAEILRLWHSATKKVAVLFFGLTGFLMVFGTDVVVLLFSHRYIESSGLFRIFLLLLPLRITVYGALLMAAGRSKLILRAACGTLLLNAVLVFLLTRMLGLPGAALATVIAVYAMAGWQLYHCADLLGVTWGRIFPWQTLGRLAAASVVSGAASWLAASWLPAGPVRLAMGLIAFAAAYLGLLWSNASLRSELRGVLGTLRGRA